MSESGVKGTRVDVVLSWYQGRTTVMRLVLCAAAAGSAASAKPVSDSIVPASMSDPPSGPASHLTTSSQTALGHEDPSSNTLVPPQHNK